MKLAYNFLIIIFAVIVVPPVFAATITVSTDKTTLTEPYQKLLITGMVESIEDPKFVTIKIFDPDGKLVYTPQVPVDDKGKYRNVAKVETSWVKNGEYKIEVSSTKFSDVATTTIQLQKGMTAPAPAPTSAKTMVSGFEVEHSKNANIASTSVNEEEKTITFVLAGGVSAGSIWLNLPSGLISNPSAVWVDDIPISNFQASKRGDLTQVTIPVGSGASEVVIMGSSVVPEFGTIAVIILATGIIVTIMTLRANKLVILR